MEAINNLLKLSYKILYILYTEKTFIREKILKQELNKKLNEFKRINNDKEINIRNDVIELYFNDCVRYLLTYSLVEYKIQLGVRYFKINTSNNYFISILFCKMGQFKQFWNDNVLGISVNGSI